MKRLAMAVLVALFAASPVLADEQQSMLKAGCVGCHKVDGKMVGPSYKDVAAKYKGQKDAVSKLSEKVRAGGSGNWGSMAMMPNGPDKISDADLKAVIEWILKQ
jgi:cytochrome c